LAACGKLSPHRAGLFATRLVACADLSHLSRFLTEYYLIPVGLIFIAMVIFMPQGLLGFMRRWLNQ